MNQVFGAARELVEELGQLVVTRAHLLPVGLGFCGMSLGGLESLVHLLNVLVSLISAVDELIQVLFVGSLPMMRVEAGSSVPELGCLGLDTL